MLRDKNHVAHYNLDSFNVAKCSPPAFTGGTANTRGDDGGTNDPYTLFAVTGEVLVGIFGVCTTDLVSGGGGTLEVGVTGNTAALIPQTTATAIDVNEIWLDTTPSLGIDVSDALTYNFIVNGLDITESVGTADITAGQIYYICLWRPVSNNGNLTPAGTQT